MCDVLVGFASNQNCLKMEHIDARSRSAGFRNKSSHAFFTIEILAAGFAVVLLQQQPVMVVFHCIVAAFS